MIGGFVVVGCFQGLALGLAAPTEFGFMIGFGSLTSLGNLGKRITRTLP